MPEEEQENSFNTVASNPPTSVFSPLLHLSHHTPVCGHTPPQYVPSLSCTGGICTTISHYTHTSNDRWFWMSLHVSSPLLVNQSIDKHLFIESSRDTWKEHLYSTSRLRASCRGKDFLRLTAEALESKDIIYKTDMFWLLKTKIRTPSCYLWRKQARFTACSPKTMWRNTWCYDVAGGKGGEVQST